MNEYSNDLALANAIDEACDAFEDAWRSGKSPSLESFLSDVPQEHRSSYLRELLSIEIEYASSDANPIDAAALAKRFPHDIETIHACLNIDTRPDIGIGNPTTSSPLTAPPRINGYEIYEEIGAGGMGVVYRAKQIAANRIVALKLIQPLGPKYGEALAKELTVRFQTECKAVAAIEHPNVVSIYDVGESNGDLFFSMQYVPGQSLYERIIHQTLAPKEAANLVYKVTNAVTAIHQQGLIHRDIKPQNIMMHGETHEPIVMDFGLAKSQDARDGITRTDGILGTFQYMAPEQLSAPNQVTTAADIYAIGATFYHALVRRPPIQAGTVDEKMRQLLEQDPIRPSQLDASIPKDLETICLKCLEKDPAKRFLTAGDLADELKRYLDGRPIKSRPTSMVGKVWRWAKRKPAIASLTVAVVAASIIAAASATIGYLETMAARQKSEEGFRAATQTLNQLINDIRNQRVDDLQDYAAIRRQMIQTAVGYYEDFLDKRKTDPTVQFNVAETHYRLALLYQTLGSREKALSNAIKARNLQTQLLANNPADRQLKLELSKTCNVLGQLELKQRAYANALEYFSDAQQLRAQVANHPGITDTQHVEAGRLLVNIQMNIGTLHKQQGDFPEAIDAYRAAQQQRKIHLTNDPKNIRIQRDLAKGDYNLGLVISQTNETKDAIKHFEQAQQAFSKIANETDDQQDRYHLALCIHALAELQPEYESALKLYNQSTALLQQLSDDHTEVDAYQRQLAVTHSSVGQMYSEMGQVQQAVISLRAARQVLAPLASRNLNDSALKSLLSGIESEIERLEN